MSSKCFMCGAQQQELWSLLHLAPAFSPLSVGFWAGLLHLPMLCFIIRKVRIRVPTS